MEHGHDASEPLRERVIELLLSPEHWIFDGVTDIVQTLVAVAVTAVWVRRHDRKVHGK